jgi:hypothetical protein
MYSQYFEDKPIQRLLGIDIKAEQINDDALGRCLDKLFENGVSDIYQHLGEAVIKYLGLPCEAIKNMRAGLENFGLNYRNAANAN